MSAVRLIQATKFAPAEVRGTASFEVRAVNEEEQTFSGIASRTEVDRVGDVVVAAGISFTNPVVVLWQHRTDMPIGRAMLKRVGNEIHFTAKLPKVSEPGPLRDRVRDAFLSVKTGTVDSVSIGFKPLEQEPIAGGGWKYLRSEVYEISLVSCPALSSARIDPSTIKALPQSTEPVRRERLPDGLSEQQQRDLHMAHARRTLGANADRPAPLVVVRALSQMTGDWLREIEETVETMAEFAEQLDDRLRALESGQSRIIDVTPGKSTHPGAVRLIKAR